MGQQRDGVGEAAAEESVGEAAAAVFTPLRRLPLTAGSSRTGVVDTAGVGVAKEPEHVARWDCPNTSAAFAQPGAPRRRRGEP